MTGKYHDLTDRIIADTFAVHGADVAVALHWLDEHPEACPKPTTTEGAEGEEMKYTAEDFANAKFAEHPTGRVAARCGEDPHFAWVVGERGRVSDYCMALADWVPVPSRPTITESQLVTLYDWARNYSSDGWRGRDVLAEIGITIVPDPEPSNAERLKEMLKRKSTMTNYSATVVAKRLDAAGVIAPGGDE